MQNILKALENNEFKMHLQFIVDNKTKEIVCAEALSRWHNPTIGIIGPVSYIQKMEEYGIISKHDFYMFELVCQQLEKWNNTPLENIILSCNFTKSTLSEKDFFEKIQNISKRYSFDKSCLAIEITEYSMESDLETTTKNVTKCRELGFRVYLDDLGSGYTTLANLCDYPINVVKIDRNILYKTSTEKGKALFNGLISLAHSLELKVICEGVETDEHLAIIEESNCDFIQGFYYSKPMPIEECELFINEYSKSL